MSVPNRIFKTCPACGHHAKMMIREFGECIAYRDFDLSNPRTLDDLSASDLADLEEALESTDERFFCQNPTCNHSFWATDKKTKSRQEIIKRICD